MTATYRPRDWKSHPPLNVLGNPTLTLYGPLEPHFPPRKFPFPPHKLGSSPITRGLARVLRWVR
jgi:hypothetical protein